MDKKQKEYQDKYGDVPNSITERFIHLVATLNLKEHQKQNLYSKIRNTLNTEWETVHFTFNIIPEGAPRPRLGKAGRFYVKGSSSDATFFKNYLKTSEEKYERIITSCIFKSEVYLPIPNNMSKLDKILAELKIIRPLTTPDWDNIGKKYSDMVQHELLLNDSLIIDGQVKKFYSSKPRVEINLCYMKNFDSEFNRRKVFSWKDMK